MLRKSVPPMWFLVISLFVLALSRPVLSDFKWQQFPDVTRNGIDIRMDGSDQVPRILGDDFKCIQPGLITDVHFWGSWKRDVKTNLDRIHVEIHSDIPADPQSFSQPGPLLWQHDFIPSDFTETLYQDLCPKPNDLTVPCDWEWWWDPYVAPPAPDSLLPLGDQKIWKYDINIDPNIAFLQQGTPTNPIVYWLVIYVSTNNSAGFTTQFGWKTAEEHWNDDGVFGIPGAGWQELIYPPNHPFVDQSIDLAFEITTTSKEACCFKDGSCTDMTGADCLAAGGNPQGMGSNCTNVQCPPPPITEACCMVDAAGNVICNDLTVADCLLQNGTPQGAGTDCLNLTPPCDNPPLQEACCLPDGTCIDATLADCKAKGGTPQGVNTNCTNVQCDPIGNLPCLPAPVICANTGQPAVAMSINIGLHDNFAAPADPGATPDPILLAYINNCSAPGTALQLDQVPGQAGVPANSWFGHTFANLPFGIQGATLEFRARATSGGGAGGTFNDHISFVNTINVTACTPTWLWSNRFMNLPEAGGTWNPGQTQTFCLDLGALPISNTAATTSVISQLSTGQLGIRVDDDSGIDYMVLTIMVCPCEFALPVTIQAEKIDSFFKPDTEPASPSAAMLAAFSFPRRGFDYRTATASFIPSDRWFGHTFTGLPTNIVGATLEIRMAAAGGLSTNDSIALEFLNPSFAWGHGIATLPPANPWGFGAVQTYTLDLGNLPPSGSGVTSVLGQLSDGELDVFVQDDTAVDYMILRLRICCDNGIPGDNDHDGDVDLVDHAIQAAHWLIGVP